MRTLSSWWCLLHSCNGNGPLRRHLPAAKCNAQTSCASSRIRNAIGFAIHAKRRDARGLHRFSVRALAILQSALENQPSFARA